MSEVEIESLNRLSVSEEKNELLSDAGAPEEDSASVDTAAVAEAAVDVLIKDDDEDEDDDVESESHNHQEEPQSHSSSSPDASPSSSSGSSSSSKANASSTSTSAAALNAIVDAAVATTPESATSTVGEDLYNYDTVFPSLPIPTGNHLSVANAWNNVENKLSIKRHLTTTQVFHVPVEERRYRDVAHSFGNETNKKCEDIANRLGVKVEICCSKDQSLHIVISGPEEKVLEAKRSIVNELQTERDQKIRVPKEHHKFLIGKGGSVLKELQEKTCTSIQVPKPEANSDLITITGPKDGIEQAMHEIQLIVDEQSKTGFERLNIPKLHHPWIRGFNNEIANEIAARTGAKINIPPPQIEKDEIAVSGEREKVDAACAELRRISAEKSQQKVTKLAVQITKSQHKLIIGKNGSTVQEIFRDYDVYVQVPKLESNSETIYLYGQESKLSAALAQVCAKANSVVNIKCEAPSWMHRHLIGEKGSNISKITADYPNTHVKFEPDNKITMDGPPDEVEKVRERLEAIINGIKSSLVCEEISVDPKYYPQLVGKKYDNIIRLNKEHGVVVRVPQENTTQLVRIEGSPEAVQKAKAEFLELVKKVENERSKDIIIDQKYHSNLIGKSGKNLIEIRAKFNDVQISIPNQEEKSDVVTIRGNKLDVEKCYKHLQQFVREFQESNYQDELHIFKQFHRMLIGKQGAFIRKIREETQTRIEVPAEDSDSDSILIVGKQENVLKARKLIEEKVKELVKIEEDCVEIAHSLHTALIGKGGAIIKQIRKECGGVIINFPPEATPSDRIVLKGPRDDIDKAKNELLKLAKNRNDANYTEEVYAKAEFHKFLVGRKGNTINSLRDKHNVRIIFPTSSTSQAAVAPANDNNNNKSPNDFITIIGKEENVKAVKLELEATVKTLEEQVTDEVHVDQKWHKNFTAKRAKLINKISEDNCGVKISFPKANSDVVSVKGPKDAVEAAKKRILDVVYEFENQVTIELVIPQKHHASLIGKKGIYSQQISDQFRVEIQIPAKSDNVNNGSANNGSANDTAHPANGTDHANEDDYNETTTSSSSKSDCVYITGFKDDVEKAKEALLALVPISEDCEFPQKFHKNLLENKAEVLRDLGNSYNVQINVPKRGATEANYVTVVGTKENIELARSALKDKLAEFELHNFTVEINDIKADLMPQLRGRNGIEAERLEKKYSVRIDFSRKDEPNKVVIRGLEKNVLDCEAFIKKKMTDEEAKTSQEILIDNRVHSRIIGQKGKTLAKIMEKYKVDVKFAGRSSDVVVVKGDNADAIEDACDYLKNLEEEYLQDVVDKEQYTHPAHKSSDNDGKANGPSKGFVVRGAPWEQQQGPQSNGGNSAALNPNEPVPDTSNMDDFPTITSAVTAGQGSSQKMTWGPSRR